MSCVIDFVYTTGTVYNFLKRTKLICSFFIEIIVHLFLKLHMTSKKKLIWIIIKVNLLFEYAFLNAISFSLTFLSKIVHRNKIMWYCQASRKCHHRTLKFRTSYWRKIRNHRPVIKENTKCGVFANQNNVLFLWCAILNYTPKYYGMWLARNWVFVRK